MLLIFFYGTTCSSRKSLLQCCGHCPSLVGAAICCGCADALNGSAARSAVVCNGRFKVLEQHDVSLSAHCPYSGLIDQAG
mmetsp:Transcript_25844/g.42707  ORF Transcript_25844/g.42707 Transcript_25844/m.42707 type:complete len:80 (+) Transcript_25844:56-295(+)